MGKQNVGDRERWIIFCFSLLYDKRVFLEGDGDREGGSGGCRGGDEREEKGEQSSGRDVPASVMPH